MVDWDSPTWGHNATHVDPHGSHIPDPHTENAEDY